MSCSRSPSLLPFDRQRKLNSVSEISFHSSTNSTSIIHLCFLCFDSKSTDSQLC